MNKWKSIHSKSIGLLESFHYLRKLTTKGRIANCMSACNTIRILKERDIIPQQIIDVGAHKSEWTSWLAEEWPSAEIISFEPNEAHIPLGNVHRMALGNVSGKGILIDAKKACGLMANVVYDYSFGDVTIQRFDELDIKLLDTCILKVDAENMTAKAIDGFGGKLDQFSAVHVEMSQMPEYKVPIREIERLLSGFPFMEIVQSTTYNGRVLFYDKLFSR